MSGFEALGCAASVLQVIDFGTQFLRKAWEIYRSDTVENLVSDLQSSSTHMQRMQQKLQSIPATDEAIQSSAEKCVVILKDLLGSLETVARDGRGRRRHSPRQAFMAVWREDKLKGLEARLDSAKLDLMLHITVNVRTTARTTLDRQHLTAKQMMIKMDEMSSDMKGIVESKATSNDISSGIGSLTLDYLTCRLPEEGQDEVKGALLDALFTSIQRSQGLSDFAAPSTIELSQGTRHKLEQVFIHRLRYNNMRERESSIKEAQEGTFLWVLEDKQTAPAPASNIRAWLETDDQLYWITGKAGSGKSTLMRYMCQPIPLGEETGSQEGGKGVKARCEQYLKQWAGDNEKLTVASFYFWAIGDRSQASQEGLFRTILVQLLAAHPDVIPIVSPSRWEFLCLFNEDPTPFTDDELKAMFLQAVVGISSRAKVALFIDGLDEFDGDCKVLINLLKECASSPIKLCVASRPWNEFSDAFENSPSLKMEDLTRHDIAKYVMATFEENPQFGRLQQQNANFAHDLMELIVYKASGVFLWVTVVVASLSSGMADGDRIEDLERVLDHLPTELEKLYEKMMSDIKPQYLEHATQLFKLMSSCTTPPSLLLFWFADEENFMEQALHGDTEITPHTEIQGRREDMRRRLGSRCRGLLEIHNDTTNPADGKLGGTVRYLHTTVADFVSSPLGKQKLNQLLEGDYDPYLRLSAASVAVARILERWRRVEGLDDVSIFEPYISNCLYYASRVPPESKRETLQLMNKLRLSIELEKSLVEWDSSRAIWSKTVLMARHRGLRSQAYTVLDELDHEAHFLCMATQGLVLEYTKAKAPRGCLLEGEPPWKPKNRGQMVHTSFQSLRGIPEGPALSLLSLPSLTDSRSYDMFQYLLRNGAKLNIELKRILALRVERATPWEEILAKAVRAFVDGVGDEEKENVSKCLRLMIDRGAKVKENTVDNAFQLAFESKNCSGMSRSQLLHYLREGGPRTTGDGLGISPHEVYNALKGMQKDSTMAFHL
ncbi:hypothetical protein CC79DRAFT_1391923 [Sarocladium strictum]